MSLIDLFRTGKRDNEAFNKLVSIMQQKEVEPELARFLDEDQSLKSQFFKLAGHPGLASGDVLWTRYTVSQFLSSYAMACAERGNPSRAVASCLFARAFARENANVLAVQAEIYLAWEDQIAARYAARMLDTPVPRLTGVMGKALADPESVAAQQEIRDRMEEVIRICSQHPEWRDSYPLKQAAGLAKELE